MPFVASRAARNPSTLRGPRSSRYAGLSECSEPSSVADGRLAWVVSAESGTPFSSVWRLRLRLRPGPDLDQLARAPDAGSQGSAQVAQPPFDPLGLGGRCLPGEAVLEGERQGADAPRPVGGELDEPEEAHVVAQLGIDGVVV